MIKNFRDQRFKSVELADIFFPHDQDDLGRKLRIEQLTKAVHKFLLLLFFPQDKKFFKLIEQQVDRT